MPWSKNDYPDSMKNLQADVRSKAIEIANALLDDGYEEGRAIPIAIDRARSSVEGGGEGRPVYHLQPKENGDGWQLIKEDGKRSILADDTKSALSDRAKEYAREHDAILVVHQADGSEEQRLYE